MQKCRGCGADVPANAPLGHCPKCLLDLGFGPSPGNTDASPPLGGSGRALGDYELIEQIGRGGMGVIYKARQTKLNRLVALKMVREGEFASPTLVQRFHLEAEAAANLHHPNIVPIYETGEHQGEHFFSMELIEGRALDRFINGSGFSFDDKPEKASPRDRQEQTARIIAKVARAVDYAHQHGVLHRDLKPSNIILDGQGEPHLTDFGVAKVIGHAGSSLTASGAIMGTPSYMSPEQAAGQSKRITTAADIYSLGAILYAMLTGRPPFRADTPVETLKQVVEQDPKHPSTLKEGLDRDLATICMKCLEKEPQRRYASGVALAEDLERWLRREPIEARRAGPVIRVRRWVQRNPAPAALILGLCLGFLVCAALLYVTLEANRNKDRALGVIKEGLDRRLNDLWLDTNRGAFEPIAPPELAAYAGSEWLSRRGPSNKFAFGVYVYDRPGRTLGALSPLLVELGNELGLASDAQVEIEMLMFRSYESALAALQEGRTHFMRMGPSSYLQVNDRDSRAQLLASQIHADPLTLAIFTRTNSIIHTCADLRGKSFGFGDTNSTTGNYVAKWVLLKAGLRLADLARSEYTMSHAEVRDGVLRGKFDAGAGNYDLIKNSPELRIIATYSLTNLGLCWVASPTLESQLVDKLRQQFLSITNSPVLRNLESKVTGFRVLKDEAFGELRKIMRESELFSKPAEP
jgi:ABC-type phosphate/phosphonate transport system substrate-binding protein/tRNA A-37 threonylcarbamoyl transferase component Bud32